MDKLPVRLDEYPKNFDSWVTALAEMGIATELGTEGNAFYPIAGGRSDWQLEYFEVRIIGRASRGLLELEAEATGHGQTPFEALQAAVRRAAGGAADVRAYHRSSW